MPRPGSDVRAPSQLEFGADETLEAALLASTRAHLRHHARFYASTLLGLAVWTAASGLRPALRTLVAGDVFFAIYLASTALLALRGTPEDLRKHASYEDEGIFLIILLTLSAASLSLASLFALIREAERPDLLLIGLTIASLPLGWFTLHTVAAFRYAHLYYTQTPAGAQGRDAAGLAFPGTHEPALWDFLYFSFVVGMTAQASDVSVLTTTMRRFTLGHCITSFFFNTVLLALAVNLAVSYG